MLEECAQASHFLLVPLLHALELHGRARRLHSNGNALRRRAAAHACMPHSAQPFI
jgi:hypothetical protein